MVDFVQVGGNTAEQGYLLVDIDTWYEEQSCASVQVIDVINLADTDGLEGQFSVRLGVVYVSDLHKGLADSYGLNTHIDKLARATYVAACEDGVTYQKEINIELTEDGFLCKGDTGEIDTLILAFANAF
jgi:hypothetical protein